MMLGYFLFFFAGVLLVPFVAGCIVNWASNADDTPVIVTWLVGLFALGFLSVLMVVSYLFACGMTGSCS